MSDPFFDQLLQALEANIGRPHHAVAFPYALTIPDEPLVPEELEHRRLQRLPYDPTAGTYGMGVFHD